MTWEKLATQDPQPRKERKERKERKYQEMSPQCLTQLLLPEKAVDPSSSPWCSHTPWLHSCWHLLVNLEGIISQIAHLVQSEVANFLRVKLWDEWMTWLTPSHSIPDHESDHISSHLILPGTFLNNLFWQMVTFQGFTTPFITSSWLNLVQVRLAAIQLLQILSQTRLFQNKSEQFSRKKISGSEYLVTLPPSRFHYQNLIRKQTQFLGSRILPEKGAKRKSEIELRLILSLPEEKKGIRQIHIQILRETLIHYPTFSLACLAFSTRRKSSTNSSVLVGGWRLSLEIYFRQRIPSHFTDILMTFSSQFGE